MREELAEKEQEHAQELQDAEAWALREQQKREDEARMTLFVLLAAVIVGVAAGLGLGALLWS